MKLFYKFALHSFIIFILFGCNSLIGQQINIYDQYRFKSITIDDGLNNNRVRGMDQDNYGFIWIGTRTGISKYDGYSVIQYNFFFDDTTSTVFRETREILCDSHGKIWVAGEYGLCSYNTVKDRFERFIDPKDKKRIDFASGLVEDHDGLLWVGTRNEIFTYKTGTNEITYLKTDLTRNLDFSAENPDRLMVDKNNNLWIGYQKNGLVFYDRKANRTKHYLSDGSPESLGENAIERIYEDDQGTIWIGLNNNGFSKFIPGSNTFKTYYPDPDIQESGRVRGLLKDSKGNFWIGSRAGLYLFNTELETCIRYAHSSHPISELSHNSIQLLMADNQDGLWIGTFAGGVCYTNLNTSGFTKYSYTPFESPYYLNDKNVYSLAVDNNKNIWIGTENGGLNFLDNQTGKFNYYSFNPSSQNCPLSNNIKDIKVDKNNNIWFATYGGGFSYFNTETQKFYHTVKSDENPDGFPNTRIYSLLLDPYEENILWVGAINGLYNYNISDKIFQQISSSNQHFQNCPDVDVQVNTIVNCLDQKILFGTNKLIVYEPLHRVFKTITDVNGEALSSVNFILIDKKGFIWFDNGNSDLIRTNAGFSDFRIFKYRDGLPYLNYLEAQDDEKGNLWLSTNNGIVKFENFINNQDTIIYKIYNKSDNLQSQEFIYHSKAVSPEGEIYFGGINGFNSFNPEKVKANPFPPIMRITGIKIGNKPVQVNEKVLGRIILKKPILEAELIKIHHKVKILTIEFTALHYSSPGNNKFDYMLEGYDDHWTSTNASIRFANYSSLPAGNYTFKVRGYNNSGIMSEANAEIKIKVLSPFWQRWWFYLLIIIIIGFVIRTLVKLRENQLKSDKITLERKLNEGEEKLNKQLTEIEQQKKDIEEKENTLQINRWFNEGLGLFSEILNKNKEDFNKLSYELISNIVTYIKAEQGGLFIASNKNSNTVLELTAHYAYNREKLALKTFYPGEGEVGVCYESKNIIYLDNIPKSYAKLTSGLGEKSLTYLLFIPLKRDDFVMGVIELASFEKIEQFKIDFIEKISDNIVSVLHGIKTNETINEMLKRSQEQTEILHAQDEEMRQNLEEMKATQEDAANREKILLKQIEEIKSKSGNSSGDNTY